MTLSGFPLSKRVIWERYKNPHELIGVRFGDLTKYMMMDIDRGSPYHPKRSRKKFEKIFDVTFELGLDDYAIVESSESGGLHIYFPFPEPVGTFNAACAFKYALIEAGFEVASGKLELFPNAKYFDPKRVTNYNAHRLPMQTRSYLLDHDLWIISNRTEDFLHSMEWAAQKQDMDTFKRAMELGREKHTLYQKKSKKGNSVKKWREDLETNMRYGWTDYHQTNDLLKTLACYFIVFEGLQGEALIEKMYQTAIAMPGYVEYCRHQHHIRQRCAEWAKSAQKFWSPLHSYPERNCLYREMFEQTAQTGEGQNQNEITKLGAQSRLAQVMNYLKRELAELPRKIKDLEKLIIETAQKITEKGLSKSTLHKPYNLHRTYASTLYVV